MDMTRWFNKLYFLHISLIRCSHLFIKCVSLTIWDSSWHFCLTSLTIPSSLERCWSISSRRSWAICFWDSRSCRLLLSLSKLFCMSCSPKHTSIYTRSWQSAAKAKFYSVYTLLCCSHLNYRNKEK